MKSSIGLKSEVSSEHECMVTDCSKGAKWYCNDGTFWIKCCDKDRIDFKEFAQSNGLNYSERPIPPKTKVLGILGGTL